MTPVQQGFRDGLPIGAGYFAVAFSLGMIARQAGLTVPEGFLSSLLTRASAGEYGSYTLMAAGAAYVEVFVLCIIANLRYLLMGTALIQRLDPSEPQWKRIIASLCITDEIFAISMAYSTRSHWYENGCCNNLSYGKGSLRVSYTAGAMVVAGLLWASGTAMGIWAGNIMPAPAVSALSVALYGMFIAIITGPAKKDRAILLSVVASFLLGSLFAYLPLTSGISQGIRTVVLTVVIASAAAILKPVNDEE